MTQAVIAAVPPIVQKPITYEPTQQTDSKIRRIYNDTVEKIISTANNTAEKITSVATYTAEKISSIVARIKIVAISLIPDVHFELTDAKIKQIFSFAFSGYTFLAAKTFGGGMIPTTFLQWTAASPLLVISGAAAWYALSIVDYDSPVKLEKIRKLAQKIPFADLLYQHGWQNLFTYQILSPKDFETAFHNFACTLSFKDLYALCKEAKKELTVVNSSSAGCPYQIPSLGEWAGKFKQETADLTPVEILEEYPLSDLIELKILTDEELIPFKKTQSLLDELVKEKEVFNKIQHAHIQDARDKSVKAIHKAQSTLSEIDAALGPNGSLEKLPFLSDEFEAARHKANEEHQANMAKIKSQLQTIQNLTT